MFTNDPVRSRTTFTISGKVLNFVTMEPRYARLVGDAGTDIKKAITITQEKAYPFKILKATARNGKDITFDVQAFSREGTDGYIVTIANTRTTAGRYADTVILSTDSSIKPTITVPVYGQILSAASPAKPMPATKKAGDS